MSEKRFKIVHLNLKRLDMCDIQDTAQEIPTFYNDLGYISSVEPVCELLNKLNDECKFLAKQRDYWKQKYEEGTETFTLPPNCDECDFLGSNGICGYCKFTLNCYDSKEDLIDGEVLPNCPLKPLINMNGQLRKQIQNYEKLISNSYVGIEETLDGFVGKYVIWEDELQKYKNGD